MSTFSGTKKGVRSYYEQVREKLEGAFQSIVPKSVPDLTLVVPGLNEAESLPLLAAQVREALDQVLVGLGVDRMGGPS